MFSSIDLRGGVIKDGHIIYEKFDINSNPLIIEKRKNNAVMIVRDYGVGIEEQEKEKIFERYYKRDRENQRVPGMGLGLSIIKEIVDLHNAKIELVNRNNGLDVILIFEKEEE